MGADTGMMTFEMFQKQGKDAADAAMKSAGVLARGAQVVAVEAGDYVKHAIEVGTATLEKLAAVKSFDKAVEIQGEYARASYEGFVSQSTKIGEILTSTAREAFAPFEGLVAKPAA